MAIPTAVCWLKSIGYIFKVILFLVIFSQILTSKVKFGTAGENK